MANGYVNVTAKQIKKRDTLIKKITIAIVVLLLLLLFSFAILSLIYRGGDFVITLDPQFSLESGLKLYDNKELKDDKIKLYAKGIDFMDNISIKWLPEDLSSSKGGSHNGENYIAYTFFVENTGKQKLSYWYEVKFLDIIKKVDEAVRIMIIKNDEKIVYAKKNALTKKEEEGTKAFYSDNSAVLEQRKDMKPNEMDKFTIVMWLEGDDPDCLDDIIGGELKLKLRIIENYTAANNKDNK